jgi:hypothetical protein
MTDPEPLRAKLPRGRPARIPEGYWRTVIVRGLAPVPGLRQLKLFKNFFVMNMRCGAAGVFLPSTDGGGLADISIVRDGVCLMIGAGFAALVAEDEPDRVVLGGRPRSARDISFQPGPLIAITTAGGVLRIQVGGTR